MQYVILVFQGTTPLPGTPEWDAVALALAMAATFPMVPG